MPNDTTQKDIAQGESNHEEMLVAMLEELENTVAELSQRVEALEQQGNASQQ